MSSAYVDLIKKSGSPPVDRAFTIPSGFTERKQDQESVERQRVLQEFEEIVLRIELAARANP